MPFLKPSSILALSLLLSAPLPAQKDPVLPGKPLAVLHIDGPGKIARELGETRLGKLLSGPELAPDFQGLVGMVDRMGGPQLEAFGVDYEALKEAVLGFQGRLTLAVGMKLEGLISRSWKQPEQVLKESGFWVVVILAPGKGDPELGPQLAKLEAILEEEGGDRLAERRQEFQVGDRTLVGVVREGFGMTFPFTMGSKGVMVLAADLQDRLDALFGEGRGEGRTLDPDLDRYVLASHLDLKEILGSLFPEPEEGEAPPFGGEGGMFLTWIRQALEGLGLFSLESLELGVRGEEEFLIGEMKIRLGEDPGLLGAFFTGGQEGARLLDYAPLQRESWSVGRVDVPLLCEKLEEIVDGFAMVSGMGSEDLAGRFEDFFRVRLEQDLLDHLDGGILSVPPSDPAAALKAMEEGNEVRGPLAGVEGFCMALGLKDGRAFAKSFETLLRSRAQHVSRKKEEHRGFTVYNFKLGGLLKVYYCITADLFLFALGDEGAKGILAVLDEVAARMAGKPRAEFSPAVQARLEHSPENWSGIGVGSPGTQLGLISKVLKMKSPVPGRRFPSESREDRVFFDRAAEWMTLFSRLARKYDLETLVQTTSFRDGVFLSRTIW